MSNTQDQCNSVQSPIIMKIDGPDDSSSNENSSETENSTSSNSSNIPTTWVYGSSCSKSPSSNPFLLNNKRCTTFKPSFLRPSQLASKSDEDSSEKNNGPLAPSKLNPFKRNFDDSELDPNKKDDSSADDKKSNSDNSNSNEDNSIDKTGTPSVNDKISIDDRISNEAEKSDQIASTSTNNTQIAPVSNHTDKSNSAIVTSFVFGQNVQDRVVTEGTTDTPKNESNGSDIATSSNGTSENLFTSLLKKETNETLPKENHAISLTESAKAYEESRAIKRKYEEVEVITGEEGEKNVIQLCCKLFAFHTSIWQDRGRGTMRLNDKEDGESRLVWRNVGSHRVMLNTLIWAGMTVERASPKSIRITAMDSSGQIKVFLLMAGPTDMDTLQEALMSRVSIAKCKVKEDNEPSAKKPTL